MVDQPPGLKKPPISPFAHSKMERTMETIIRIARIEKPINKPSSTTGPLKNNFDGIGPSFDDISYFISFTL
ncbi:MAG: hypothetical protein ACTSUE_23850 [Promethearchaeota archaeon]